MEEGGYKFTFRRFGWVFLGEFERDLVDAAFPVGPLLARDASVPVHDVRGPVPAGDGSSVEAEGVISAPCLSFLMDDRERVLRDIC